MDTRNFRPCSLCGEHRPDLVAAAHGDRTLALCPHCEATRLAVIAASAAPPRWDLEPARRPLACACCRAPIAAGADCWTYDGDAEVTICRRCGTPRRARVAA